MQKFQRQLENVNYLTRTKKKFNDFITVDGKNLINFSSNDYLGLSKNKNLISSSKKWTDIYGTSLSSSRLISGNLEKIVSIEKKISKNTGFEKTLILGGGFLLNSTLIPALTGNTLGKRNKTLIFSDKLNHSSINIGCQLTRQKILRYKHLDLSHLEYLLKKASIKIPKIIISETLFSMDGDVVDIKNLRLIAKKYNCLLYLDEAHSMGVFGKRGFGLSSLEKNNNEVVVGTFGKSFGSYGGFVASSEKNYKKIVNLCSGLIYSTALTPGNYGSIDEAVNLMPKLNKLRIKLLENSNFLISQLNKIGVSTGNSSSHIIPLIFGDENKCIKLQSFLKSKGFFVKIIRPPTVAKGSERIRLSLTATMSSETIKKFIEAIKDFT